MSINWEKLALGVVVGYLGMSILSPKGYSLSPGNDEIGAALMIGGGGPFPHSPGGQTGGGGGGIHTKWPMLRAWGTNAAGFPDPSIPSHQSQCTPEDLECGSSFSCLYHKTMCALGFWK